jgi:hypothetical protein
MTKAERKTLEKLARSAYAVHLDKGLLNGSYTVGEAQRYWAYAMEDAGGHCPNYVSADANVFSLLANYKANVERLAMSIEFAKKAA